MPDALEYVVRPYTTPDVHGSIIIPATPRGSRERATLTWGADSSITVPAPEEVVEGVNFETVCCKENLNELDRESEEMRIYQNGDETSPNWVDVERPKSMRLKKKDKNNCFGPSLSETSDIGQAINASNEMWAAALNSGTTKTSGGGKNCSVGWKFKNE